MKGIYQGAQGITLLKEGGVGKKAWKLFGTGITVDGNEYGLTGFSQTEVQEKLDKLKPGMLVEFETEQRGNFTNIKQKTEIAIVAQATANYTPPKPAPQPAAPAQPQARKTKPTVPFMTDQEVFDLMGKCIEAVKNSLKEQKIVVESLTEMTTMINSVFIACREERKGERRWE